MTKEYISTAFSASMLRQSSSWRWVYSDFAEEFAALQTSDALLENGSSEKIWQTSQKFVLKVHTPSRRIIVYKSYRMVKDWFRCIYRLSPLAREALNYQQLLDIGLPMARLLAAGDTRSFFILKGGFLVTEYVQNTSDGRDFCDSGQHASNPAFRDAFIQQVFANLAKMHDHGWIHRGSTPANFLYRRKDDSLETVWIDVATCRKVSRFTQKFRIPDDFVNFFRFFDFTAEQRKGYEELYLSNAHHNLFTSQTLFEAVEKKLFANSKYQRRLERSRK
ncbi:MAG: hypothetical protein IKP00_08645 [Victivallales bacterium]|nr:hypothetical protein [Victivallales bacterium]